MAHDDVGLKRRHEGVDEQAEQAGHEDQGVPLGELVVALRERDEGSDSVDPDPAGLELRADDTEPADDHDRTGEHIQHTDTRWSLELDNPYLWLDVAPL